MSKSPCILAFDTSGHYCTAAILQHGTCTHVSEDMSKGQAERLMPLLQELLERRGVSWCDLDAIGVGVGPGNFTGIRLSIAAARGLAVGLKRPALGVTCLQAQAFQSKGEVYSLIDAKRGRVFAQRFNDGIAYDDARLCNLDDLDVKEARTYVGRGVDIQGRDGELCAPQVHLAKAISLIASERFTRGTISERPAAFYIRAADAAPPKDAPPVILKGSCVQ